MGDPKLISNDVLNIRFGKRRSTIGCSVRSAVGGGPLKLDVQRLPPGQHVAAMVLHHHFVSRKSVQLR